MNKSKHLRKKLAKLDEQIQIQVKDEAIKSIQAIFSRNENRTIKFIPEQPLIVFVRGHRHRLIDIACTGHMRSELLDLDKITSTLLLTQLDGDGLLTLLDRMEKLRDEKVI